MLITEILSELKKIQVELSKGLLLETTVIKQNALLIKLQSELYVLKAENNPQQDEEKGIKNPIQEAEDLLTSLLDKTKKILSFDKNKKEQKQHMDITITETLETKNTFPLNDELVHVFEYLTLAEQAKIKLVSKDFYRIVKSTNVYGSSARITNLIEGGDLIVQLPDEKRLTHEQVLNLVRTSIPLQKEELINNCEEEAGGRNFCQCTRLNRPAFILMGISVGTYLASLISILAGDEHMNPGPVVGMVLGSAGIITSCLIPKCSARLFAKISAKKQLSTLEQPLLRDNNNNSIFI
jgi:hypothetical protein